jgi:hypothetical protein
VRLEIYDCADCGRLVVKIKDRLVTTHHCVGSLKPMIAVEVSALKLREALDGAEGKGRTA